MSPPQITQQSNHTPINLGDAWIELAQQAAIVGKAFGDQVRHQGSHWQVGEAELMLLWSCRESASGVGQKELAETMAVSPAHISALVERLRQQGLLTGCRDPQDRRRQLWQLSDQGYQLLDQIRQDLTAQIANPHSSLRIIDTRALIQSAERWIATLRNELNHRDDLRGAA